MMRRLPGLGNKHAILLLLCVATLTGLFWTSARYPSLDAKALMGGELALEDPLSFEAVLPIQPGDPSWKRIAYTPLNWLHTNQQGMAFGILLGAALFSLIKAFRRRAFDSSFGNTLLGVAMGMPLGVCVNCAAPVAKGIHAGGGWLETTLAAMVSSPTLNVVVLTLTFSIHPIYLSVTKLAFTLVFILLVILLLSRPLFRDEVAQTIENGVRELPAQASAIPGSMPCAEPWATTLRASGSSYGRRCPSCCGGAARRRRRHLRADRQAGPRTRIRAHGAVLVAVVGLFLPVPVAFDVILAAVLLAAGLPILYVMILLFVLGIFSCDSAFIVATTLSRRVAVAVSGVLVVMGLLARVTAHVFYRSEQRSMLVAMATGSPGALHARPSAPFGEPPQLPASIESPSPTVRSRSRFNAAMTSRAPRLVRNPSLAATAMLSVSWRATSR